MPAQTTGTLTAPSVAFTVPLAEIALDHTGKPISRSDFTSRHPASITRPVTPRAISEVASRSPNIPSVLSVVHPTTRISPGPHCSTATRITQLPPASPPPLTPAPPH